MRFILNNKKRNLSDEEILTRFIETGDPSLVGVLFNRYAKLVMGLSLKYLKNEDEASDMTMHIFKKLLEKLKDYEIRTFKNWLYTFSKNECLMKLRKSSNISYNIEFANIEQAEDNKEETYTEEHFKHLSKAIKDLKAEQRKCIELFYLKEMSYNEIENQTGYSWKEIKSHIQNGKRNLRNNIKL